MVSAIWKDTTIATTGETVVVEGNHYFPPSAVDFGLLEMSPHTTVCPIKGVKRRSKLTPDRRPILTPLASVPGPAARRVAVS